MLEALFIYKNNTLFSYFDCAHWRCQNRIGSNKRSFSLFFCFFSFSSPVQCNLFMFYSHSNGIAHVMGVKAFDIYHWTVKQSSLMLTISRHTRSYHLFSIIHRSWIRWLLNTSCYAFRIVENWKKNDLETIVNACMHVIAMSKSHFRWNDVCGAARDTDRSSAYFSLYFSMKWIRKTHWIGVN